MSKNLSIEKFAALVSPQIAYGINGGSLSIIPIENIANLNERVRFTREIQDLIGKFRDDSSIKNLSRRLLEKLNEPPNLTDEESRDLTKLLDYISKLFANATYTKTGELDTRGGNTSLVFFAQENILKPLATINEKAKQKIQALLSTISMERLKELRGEQTRLRQTIEGFKHNFQQTFSQAA
jgi:hypothetical protein